MPDDPGVALIEKREGLGITWELNWALGAVDSGEGEASEQLLGGGQVVIDFADVNILDIWGGGIELESRCIDEVPGIA